PGNYHFIGNRASGLRPVPTDHVNIAVPCDGTFWGQYMCDPGAFATAGGASLHSVAPSGWDPNVWNSARMDTAETNLFPVSALGNISGLDPCIWAGMYHESDPKYATLGIVKNRCFLVNPAGPVNSTNIVCNGTVPAAYGAAQGYDGNPTTKEYTKIIPDGLLTPGSHVEYFIRRSAIGAPAIFTMSPDTNRVTPQPGEIADDEVDCLPPTGTGSTDGHRGQQFGVLPDRWKSVAFGGQGMACMLYVDLDDGYGDEAAWVTAADLIHATHADKFGAH